VLHVVWHVGSSTWSTQAFSLPCARTYLLSDLPSAVPSRFAEPSAPPSRHRKPSRRPKRRTVATPGCAQQPASLGGQPERPETSPARDRHKTGVGSANATVADVLLHAASLRRLIEPIPANKLTSQPYHTLTPYRVTPATYCPSRRCPYPRSTARSVKLSRVRVRAGIRFQVGITT
jgi:hypothetical protein